MVEASTAFSVTAVCCGQLPTVPTVYIALANSAHSQSNNLIKPVSGSLGLHLQLAIPNTLSKYESFKHLAVNWEWGMECSGLLQAI